MRQDKRFGHRPQHLMRRSFKSLRIGETDAFRQFGPCKTLKKRGENIYKGC